MKKRHVMRIAVGAAAASAAIAAAGYAVLAGSAWLRFGHPPGARTADEQDPLLDTFAPSYDIVERHHIEVDAPAALTLETARSLDMADGCLTSAIFKTRELIMGAVSVPAPRGGLITVMQHFGWGILADHPGKEIVLGAATRPWEPNPVFRAILPGEFAAFNEPGYVKIAFTLRADPVGDGRSIFRTETRAIGTDPEARRLFRRYWSLVSPGVGLIRIAMLNPIKAAAEAAAASARPPLDRSA